MINSPFNPDHQNLSADSKIVVALERISEAFRVLLWDEGKHHNLSPTQSQILIFLRFHPPEMCKINHLANEFNLTRATISDSVKALLRKKLTEKVNDQNDHRSFTIKLTADGLAMAENMSHFAQVIMPSVGRLSDTEKGNLLASLLTIIKDLNQKQVITIQRMCFTCSHYSNAQAQHFCGLLNTPLSDNELRADCPDHKALK